MEGVSSSSDHIWNANNADQMSTIYAMHPGEVEIRGVKDGMKGEKRKMTHTDFHEAFGHVGPCAGCTVCKSVKGTMRKILKKVDPHRETRMGYMCCRLAAAVALPSAGTQGHSPRFAAAFRLRLVRSKCGFYFILVRFGQIRVWQSSPNWP